MAEEPGTATLIIGQPVRAGREQDYLDWEHRISGAAARFPGFLGSEVKPPNDLQPDWVVAYTFDSIPHVQNWLNSSARQSLLDQAADLFAGPGTRQVLSQGTQISDPLVTVVISHRVAGDRVAEFLAWHAAMTRAETRFPGFRGSEVFRPIAGIQDDWTTVYRFDTAEHLEAWLTSAKRRDLLAAGHFGEFTLRTIDGSFGNWFTVDAQRGAPPPSNFKTSIAVWFGLYPTVVSLSLLAAPLHLPFWLGMLIGNLCSSFAMSYLTMPRYGTRLLRWWLTPSPDARQPVTDLAGLALVFAVNAMWAVFFWWLTVRVGLHP